MSHSPEHHIEEATHAAHATHDEFNKKVTISIAIVAAVLACISMVGHRAHNETLLLQGQALTLHTEAAIKNNEAANQWAFFQAQNIRKHTYGAFHDLLAVVNTNATAAAEQEKIAKAWQGQVDKYEKKLPSIEEEAKKLTKDSEGLMNEAKHKLEESHAVHAKANRFDYGELGVQLAIVLASLAILTKNRVMWYAGLACGGVGALVALSGQLGLFMDAGHR